jgi:hypothetical protein
VFLVWEVNPRNVFVRNIAVETGYRVLTSLSSHPLSCLINICNNVRILEITHIKMLSDMRALKIPGLLRILCKNPRTKNTEGNKGEKHRNVLFVLQCFMFLGNILSISLHKGFQLIFEKLC